MGWQPMKQLRSPRPALLSTGIWYWGLPLVLWELPRCVRRKLFILTNDNGV